MPHSGFLIRGRYRLDSRIAAGGVGQVWRATDLVLQRPVAVKLLRSAYADHPETLIRFRTEARLAGSLTHPCVAQVYDYGESVGPYLVMEFVDGPSLAGILDNGPLDPVRTADIIAQAAAGLEAAHRAGLVHRDVKPENLLLGPGNQVKITDFGIAHATGSAPLTGSGIVMGTTPYLAPERAIGAPGTPASDLYSLGIVGYECLTGMLPFDGTRTEIMAGHLHRQLPPLPDDAPTGLTDLVRFMTAKEPARRPPSAAAVAEYAGQIRDAMAAGDRDAMAVGRPPRLPATMAASSDGMAVSSVGYPHVKKFRPRKRLGIAAAAVATAAAAGLAGWLGLLSAPGSHSGALAAPVRSGPTAGSPTSKSVEVNAAELIGQPLNTVLAQLRALGLVPLLEWTRSSLPEGTVTEVIPNGSVTPGSTIMVKATYRYSVPPSSGSLPGTVVARTTSPKTGRPSPSPRGSGSPTPGSSASSSPSSSASAGSGSTGSTGSTSTSTSAGSGSAGSSSGGGLLDLLQLPGLGIGPLLP
ncbi:MAG: serine/threonine protein kinase [Streptosporangiaceae bacterium]|nr:serine/threonine protein kinase [Streptosporangiaceae bacterium]